MKLYRYQVGLYEYQTKNSIGKPYEGIEDHEHLIEDNITRIKLHVRFDEGGADSLLIIVTFMINKGKWAIRLYSTTSW